MTHGLAAAELPPAGWPGDLPHAEPLSEADAKEAADLSGVVEGYLIRCVLRVKDSACDPRSVLL